MSLSKTHRLIIEFKIASLMRAIDRLAERVAELEQELEE